MIVLMALSNKNAGGVLPIARLRAPRCAPSSSARNAWPRLPRVYLGAGVSSVRNRTRLYAAVVKVKIQPTISVPR